MKSVVCYHFEWDQKKSISNLRKHGISFEEASSVFKDSNQISIYDAEHSREEERWITLGISEKKRLLVVCHTFLEDLGKNGVFIRIYSSRKATKKETSQYKMG